MEENEQKTALQCMREAFFNIQSPPFLELDDDCFLRYLHARSLNVEKACSMLKASIKWRNDEIDMNGCKEGAWKETISLENSTGKMYVRGYDRSGRPLMYMKPRLENTNDHEGNIKHLVFTMEKTIATMKKTGQTKMSLLIDYEGFSIFTAPPMNTSRATLSILQDQYPERLHKAYLIRPPFYFNVFWGMISPFIDVKTREKIVFLPSDPEGQRNELTKDIDMSQVERSIGGDDDLEFDSTIYLSGNFSDDYLSIVQGKRNDSCKSK